MIAYRSRRRATPPTGPALLEPTTPAALERALAGRNSVPGLDRFDASAALSALAAVRDGRGPAVSEPRLARDFLGGVGLITRYGKSDTITSAGLALLAAVANAAVKGRRPYVECPECTSCDVTRLRAFELRSGHLDLCNRCGHWAPGFKRLPHDPHRFDSRPRTAGMVLPTCREDLDA